MTRFVERLSSFARVILFDRRGVGLSDPVAEAATLEERMDDVRAVMDAAGSERAALIGDVGGGDDVHAVRRDLPASGPRRWCCVGAMARSTAAEDYPWAPEREAAAGSARMS